MKVMLRYLGGGPWDGKTELIDVRSSLPLDHLTAPIVGQPEKVDEARATVAVYKFESANETSCPVEWNYRHSETVTEEQFHAKTA